MITSLIIATVLSLGCVFGGFLLGRDYWRKKATFEVLMDLFDSKLADPIEVKLHYMELALKGRKG